MCQTRERGGTQGSGSKRAMQKQWNVKKDGWKNLVFTSRMNMKSAIRFVAPCGPTVIGILTQKRKRRTNCKRAGGRSEMGHGTQAGRSVVEKHLWEGERTASGRHRLPSLGSWGTLFSRDGRMQISQEEKVQSANQPWWRDAKIHRRKSVPWKNQVPKSDRPCSQRLLLWMRDLEWEPRNDGQDLTDGKRRFAEYY